MLGNEPAVAAAVYTMKPKRLIRKWIALIMGTVFLLARRKSSV